MEVATFEKKLLEAGVKPIHLIMGKGRQVQWFVCMDELIGKDQTQKEYTLLVYDKDGRCFITPKRYAEIDLDKSYYILADPDGERICVNNDTFYNEPLCNLRFSEP